MSSPTGLPLFVYGTLRIPSVLTALLGQKQISSRPAILNSVKRLCIQKEVYPGLVEGAWGSLVKGDLLFGLSRQDEELLDRFEGEEYQKERRWARDTSGCFHECSVYVFKYMYRYRLENKIWESNFLTKEKLALFCAHYQGWRAK